MCLCLLGAMFWWTGRWLAVRWEQTGGYYSHGWLIPPVSAFFLYRSRKRLAACRRRPCPWGMLLLLPSILLHVVATAWQVGFLSGFALLGVMGGLTLTLFGGEVFRVVLFPIVFLLFMVPLPEVLIDKISFNMKLMAAQAATGVLDLIGLAAVRRGSYIRIPKGMLVVDNVCSGLKYLISLMAFAALYAHISSVKRWGKALLFAMSIPIAFVANVGRVTLMVMVAYRWGVHTTEQWYFHDLFGFVLFVIAFVSMFLVESLLLKSFRIGRRGRGEASSAVDTSPQSARDAPETGRSSAGLRFGVLSILVLAAGFSVYLSWPRATADRSGMLASIPRTIMGWRGTDYDMDDRVYDILGTRDVLSRTYRDGQGAQVQLVVVLAQEARRRTHPPEQCYRGEGYLIISSGARSVTLDREEGPRAQQVHELILERVGSTRRIAWYFYKSGGRLSTNYFFHQAGVALRKLSQPDAADVLIRVETIVPGQEIERGRAELADFLSCAMPHLLRNLP